MTGSLPAATARLWRRLSEAPQLAGFFLIGGTALSLRIGHRQSEDLDLAWSGKLLPREALTTLTRLLEFEGWILSRDDSPASFEEFQIAGMDLHDYQQDFFAIEASTAHCTKLNFFVPPSPLGHLLPPSGSPGAVIPELEVLFKTKALVTASRSASRDWLDLFLLISHHGFSIDDFATTFLELGQQINLDVAFSRLLSGTLPQSDPGYDSLLSQAPTLGQITDFFREAIADWKIRAAERLLREPPN